VTSGVKRFGNKASRKQVIDPRHYVLGINDFEDIKFTSQSHKQYNTYIICDFLAAVILQICDKCDNRVAIWL